ncbi:MAG: hypothetical protein ACI9SE_004486, partial [Neolewinella sp.]
QFRSKPAPRLRARAAEKIPLAQHRLGLGQNYFPSGKKAPTSHS